GKMREETEGEHRSERARGSRHAREDHEPDAFEEQEDEEEHHAPFKSAPVCESIREDAAECTCEEGEQTERADIQARGCHAYVEAIDVVDRRQVVNRELDAEAAGVRDEEQPHSIVASCSDERLCAAQTLAFAARESRARGRKIAVRRVLRVACVDE